MVDPPSGEIIRRWDLSDGARFHTVRSARTQDLFAAVLAGYTRPRPARLLVVDREGRLRSTLLERIHVGERRARNEVVPQLAGVALDASGERAFVVGSKGPLAEIDLTTMQTRYHRLRRREAQRRFQGRRVGSERRALWLGRGRIAVFGRDWVATGRRGLESVPSGATVLNTNTWTATADRQTGERRPHRRWQAAGLHPDGRAERSRRGTRHPHTRGPAAAPPLRPQGTGHRDRRHIRLRDRRARAAGRRRALGEGRARDGPPSRHRRARPSHAGTDTQAAREGGPRATSPAAEHARASRLRASERARSARLRGRAMERTARPTAADRARIEPRNPAAHSLCSCGVHRPPKCTTSNPSRPRRRAARNIPGRGACQSEPLASERTSAQREAPRTGDGARGPPNRRAKSPSRNAKPPRTQPRPAPPRPPPSAAPSPTPRRSPPATCPPRPARASAWPGSCAPSARGSP